MSVLGLMIVVLSLLQQSKYDASRAVVGGRWSSGRHASAAPAGPVTITTRSFASPLAQLRKNKGMITTLNTSQRCRYRASSL